MPVFDDDAPKPAAASTPHAIGQDLGRLSVDELVERVAALKAEIVRVEATIAAKSSHRSAADAIFRS
ncbi:DUF1192 domain-containing protein [Methylopila turkensis]|uniref:DUF1192 domain-containing protein n=1 Tax=Methylopila turkensis TaxID=1437816 RepID=A0A9W6JLT6_9HYPH|nr:DUF1192 domain-containing protein [Methylopila turkensis]GLK79996.1 hypothetical protein GCM10008174_17370 [Methylopila turkensis]